MYRLLFFSFVKLNLETYSFFLDCYLLIFCYYDFQIKAELFIVSI
jgi:hypothetical protein